VSERVADVRRQPLFVVKEYTERVERGEAIRIQGDNGEYREMHRTLFRLTAAIALALFIVFALGYVIGKST